MRDKLGKLMRIMIVVVCAFVAILLLYSIVPYESKDNVTINVINVIFIISIISIITFCLLCILYLVVLAFDFVKIASYAERKARFLSKVKSIIRNSVIFIITYILIDLFYDGKIIFCFDLFLAILTVLILEISETFKEKRGNSELQ